jgi:hypothetical protein
MSRLLLENVGVDFPIFGANKNLRLSLLAVSGSLLVLCLFFVFSYPRA